MMDPVKLLLALNFSGFLRQTAHFTEAVDASGQYEQGQVADEDRDPKKDPGKTTLQKAFAKADVLGMLLERRRIAAWRETDAVEAIQIYSDASPVTGEELQGLVMDVLLRDNSVYTSTLPGSTLWYGHYDSISKVVALLWSLLLVVGTAVDTMRWLLDKVVCITTDFGNEHHTIEAPDFLEAFMMWAGGMALSEAALLVRYTHRLFPNALRLAGWSHTMGKIMHRVAKTAPTWPAILGCIRNLCSFWRVRSWRMHVKRVTRTFPDVNPKDLEHFTATVAKLRFETVDWCLKALKKVRTASETYVRLEIFANVKDRASLEETCRACRDSELWRFIAVVSDLVMAPLEGMRRWGMVCQCCQEARHARMHVHSKCKKTHRDDLPRQHNL